MCYQALAVAHLMYEKVSTLMMGYPIIIYSHHKLTNLLENVLRFFLGLGFWAPKLKKQIDAIFSYVTCVISQCLKDTSLYQKVHLNT